MPAHSLSILYSSIVLHALINHCHLNVYLILSISNVGDAAHAKKSGVLSKAEEIGILIALSIMGIITVLITMILIKFVLNRYLNGPADNQGTLHTYVCLMLSELAYSGPDTCYY